MEEVAETGEMGEMSSMSESGEIAEHGDWSADVDIDALVVAVRERPVLWDRSLDAYKSRDRTTVAQAWVEICSVVNPDFMRTADEARRIAFESGVKKKWTNMKDNWMKLHKRLTAFKHPDSKCRFRRKYAHYDELSFLAKMVGPSAEPAPSSRPPPPVLPPLDEPSESPPPPPKRKKKSASDDLDEKILQAIQEATPPKKNRYTAFFESLIPVLDKFNEREMLNFQIGVLSLVKKINSEHETKVAIQSSEGNIIFFK